MSICPNPECGAEGAYNSGFTIECPNPQCQWYCEEQRLRRAEESMQRMEDLATRKFLSEPASDPDKTPVYNFGFTLPLPLLDTD
jgi:hypothetical protein